VCVCVCVCVCVFIYTIDSQVGVWMFGCLCVYFYVRMMVIEMGFSSDVQTDSLF